MILIVSTCSEPLHELEFVKPIEDILKENNIEYFIKNYKDVNNNDLNKANKIIICGTSLKDDEFIKDIEEFNWIKELKKPLLGICSGMQIIGLIFESSLKKKQEIGFYNEYFSREFLGLKGEKQVYHLHNNYMTLPEDFGKYTNSDIPQAIKHRDKSIYGILFHPEVRNKNLIIEFCIR